MNPDTQSYRCRGTNYSVALNSDRMILDARWRSSNSYELPIKRIRTVIVERKSVMPFATLTILAAIGAVVAKYNALWFLVNLTPDTAGRISVILAAASVILALPTLSRALFVSIAVTWDGQPSTFRIRFVSAYRGRHLARLFEELSSGS
jgi:hypothetical protein